MDKSMSKEDAILWIKNIINDIGSPRHSDLWGYEEALYEIQKLLKEDSAQQWIPCSERLPDQNGKYLVVGRQKAINILKFDGGRWYGKWGIVAWMPLPDCYQGDGNNEM